MRSSLRTAILAATVMLFLIVPYIPHHHHKGEVCVERVLCMHDNVYNDSHTGHEAEDTHDTSNCVKHASALQIVKKMSDDQESLTKVSAFCAAFESLSLCHVSLLRYETFVDTKCWRLSDRVMAVRQLRAPPSTL